MTTKPPLVCRIFGHKATGYAGSTPYVSINRTICEQDGLGTHHAHLMARCDRCDEMFELAKMHFPPHVHPLKLWDKPTS